jgi:hypothetical protein
MPEQTPTSPQTGETKNKLPPKLVREVTDKVYALWLNDLMIEKERKGYRNR